MNYTQLPPSICSKKGFLTKHLPIATRKVMSRFTDDACMLVEGLHGIESRATQDG